jgi:hypothetical protein
LIFGPNGAGIQLRLEIAAAYGGSAARVNAFIRRRVQVALDSSLFQAIASADNPGLSSAQQQHLHGVRSPG